MQNETLPLPPKQMRWGDASRKDDEHYVASSLYEADVLKERCCLRTNSSVLDIGCGQGRLLHGICLSLGSIKRYVGIDTHRPSIDWLTANIKLPFAKFHYVDYGNDRYNPLAQHGELPSFGAFDCIALLSVFSHMMLADIDRYLAFVARSLNLAGARISPGSLKIASSPRQKTHRTTSTNGKADFIASGCTVTSSSGASSLSAFK